MKFHFENTIEVVEIEVGKKIVGLQRKGKRPISVELTYDELGKLLLNQKYTVCSVLRSLYKKRGEKKYFFDETEIS